MIQIDARIAEAERIAALLDSAGQPMAHLLVQARIGALRDALALIVAVGTPARPIRAADIVMAAAPAPAMPEDALAFGVEDGEMVATFAEPEGRATEVAVSPLAPPPLAEPAPTTREQRGEWTEARDDLIRARWPAGDTVEAVLAALNTLPGRPIPTIKAVENRVAALRVHRAEGVRVLSEQERAARADRMRAVAAIGRAAKAARAQNDAAPAPTPTPPPAAPAPVPAATSAAKAAPPDPLAPTEDEIEHARALLREGHSETVIATRTGLLMAQVRALIGHAEARARDLLLAGGMDTDTIAAMASLPPGRVRELRREVRDAAA